MEAASVTAAPQRRRSEIIREFISTYGLILLLLALPVYYGIQDLSDDGNLTRLGNNIVEGVSNGAILALIALGYTLVYGIIELINFAHGEIFMLGSLASFALFGTFGLTPGDRHGRPGHRPAGDPRAGDAHQRVAQRDDRAGGLPAAHATRRSWRR